MSEGTIAVDGVPLFVRRSAGEGVPTVLVHGNPTDSRDWIGFMRQIAGPCIAPDLPGFGNTDAGGGFDHSMYGYARFLGQAIERLGLERFNLVVHDWGAIALVPAIERAASIERLVVINSVPLLPGYRWHWVAQLWRRRPLGELLFLANNRRMLSLILRQASGDRRGMPAEFVDRVSTSFADEQTRRAVLALYRSADEEELATAGAALGRLRCPALVLWGDRDPYLPEAMGRAYGEALPGASYERVEGAGHWPWIDRPEVIGRVAEFLNS